MLASCPKEENHSIRKVTDKEARMVTATGKRISLGIIDTDKAGSSTNAGNNLDLVSQLFKLGAQAVVMGSTVFTKADGSNLFIPPSIFDKDSQHITARYQEKREFYWFSVPETTDGIIQAINDHGIATDRVALT